LTHAASNRKTVEKGVAVLMKNNSYFYAKLMVAALVVVSLTATFFAWRYVYKNAESVANERFQSRVIQIKTAVQDRLQAYEQVLRGGVGLFSASAKVSRKEWHDYVSSLHINENYPGIQGMGFSRRILPAEMGRHVAQIRREGYTDYVIRPAGERAEYTSIVYLEPFDERNKRAFGFDMFSEATRHTAMEKARDSGKTSISAKVKLLQESKENVQAGFLMYLPVYRGGVPENVAQRKATLLGYVYSPFRMNDLMHGVLGKSAPNVVLHIYDGMDVADENEMYKSENVVAERKAIFSDTREIDINGHVWTLSFDSLPAFEAELDRKTPEIVAYAGIVLTGMLALLLWSLLRTRARATELANEMTASARESAERFRSVVDTAVDGIIVISEYGIIESCNTAAQRIFGYAAEEMIGNNIKMLMPEPYHSQHDGYLHRFVHTGEARIIGSGREVIGLRKNGTTFPMDLSVGEMRIGSDRKFTGMVHDVTERKRAEEALRETMGLQHAILESASYAIISTTVEGTILSFNPAAERMLGYQAAELIGKTNPGIFHVAEEIVARAKKLSVELGQDIEPGFEVFVAKTRLGSIDENEWTYVRKDGSTLPVLLSVTAQRDENNKVTGFLGIAADISERKKIDRMKNEFVSTVSHELRTPLTSIRGSLGLVAGGVAGEISAQAKSLIDIAYKNSERLVRLINDILDIEKIESGKMDLELKPQDLMSLIEQSIEANHAYGETYGVTFVVAEAMPGVQVKVDHDRLMQVMANLLSNAAKFSPANGKVEISVTTGKFGVRVEVADKGTGIPEAFRSHIFQKFSQADSSDTRQKGGTGLGLSISKAIIEKMGGEIGFKSNAGAGTVFYFELPVAGVENPASSKSEVIKLARNGKQQRVLICEDDKDIALLLAMMLKEGGFVSDVAYSAEQAKSLLQAKHYDAMTLDIGLPGQDGISLIRELRGQALTAGLPIVVVSAQANKGHAEVNGSYALVGWHDKPIDREYLIAQLNDILNNRSVKNVPHVLHVEDDADVRKILSSIGSGIAEFDHAETLKEASEKLSLLRYDLVVLDLGLPDGFGLEILPLLKGLNLQTPVMIFSGRNVSGEEASQVASVLMKSSTSNKTLLDTISRLLQKK
jgi:PAS domain S-box-containing protein